MATFYQFPDRHPAEIICINPHHIEVPAEFRAVEDAQLAGESIAYLDRAFEDMRDCYFCGEKKIFVARRICAAGYIGCCAACGDERLERFSRSSSESE